MPFMSSKEQEDVRKFISRVVSWPEPGEEAYINFHTTWKPKDWKEKDHIPWSPTGSAFVKDIETGVNCVTGLFSNEEVSDIYICLGTQAKTDKEYQRKGKDGKPYGPKMEVPLRNKENTIRLKAFRIDVDIYKGYETETKAQASISKFVLDAGIPEPSIMVHSGGGYHVYWTLKQAISKEQWKPVADLLLAATEQLGLVTDTGVTTDVARVLRVPGTHNCKLTKPRKVKLERCEPNDFDLDQISVPLEKFKGYVRPTNVTSNVTMADISALIDKAPEFGTMDDDLVSCIEDYKNAEYDAVDLKEVWRECGFIGNALQTGGKDINDNDQWHLLMLLSAFTKQGVKAAHAMSDQWAGYDPAVVEKKYNEKVAYIAQQGVKWPKCSTIAGKGTEACKSCKYLVQDKHPFNFTTPPVQPQTFTTYLPPIFKTLEDIGPAGYERNSVTGYWETHVDKGKEKGQLVTPIKAWLGYAHMSTNGDAMIYVHTKLNKWEEPEEIGIPLSTLSGTGVELAKILFSRAVIVDNNMAAKDMFVAWMNTLRENRDTYSMHPPYGWAADRNGKTIGFAYSGSLYTKEAKPQRIAGGDPEIIKDYTTMGTLDNWKIAARGVTNTRRAAIDAIIAAQFAAPLIKFAGENIYLNIYSVGSGAGKTTAMHVGQAVWGNPIRAMQGLTDTHTVLFLKASTIRNIPLNWDEIKGDENKKDFGRSMFQFTSGKERARSTADLKSRHVGSWQTLLVSASNDSMEEAVTAATTGTEAGFMRLFELEAPKFDMYEGRLSHSEANKIKKLAEVNYGVAGELYSQWLGANYDQIEIDIAKKQDEFQHLLNTQPEERFWLTVAVVLDLGAKYANELGLTDINRDALRKAVFERIEFMRADRVSTPRNISDPDMAVEIVGQFLIDNNKRVLRTNKIRDDKVRNSPYGEIEELFIGNTSSKEDAAVAQIGYQDRKIRINRTVFKEWLHKKQVPVTTLFTTLNRELGAEVHGRATIGAGLRLKNQSQTGVIDIECRNNQILDGLFELVTRPAGGNVVAFKTTP